MHTRLTRVGTAALAAATVVSGLAFGPAATAATADTTQVLFAHDDGWVTPTGRAGAATSPTFTTAFATIADARRAATAYTSTSTGDGWTRFMTGDTCLGVTSFGSERIVVADAACDADSSEWRVDGTTLTSRTDGTVGATRTVIDGEVTATAITTGDAPLAASPDVFKAEVDFVAPLSLSGWLLGEGPDGTTVRIDGHDVATIHENAWRARVGDLSIGANTVTIELWDGDDKIDSVDLDVPVEVAPLTARASFGEDSDPRVLVSGLAQPGTTVEIRDAQGTVFHTARADANNGRWGAHLDAPNAGGERRITVDQLIGGAPNSQTDVTLEYGDAVTIDTDEDAAPGTTSITAVSGRGEAGAAVTVSDADGDELGERTVQSDGTWSLAVPEVADGALAVRATQVGRGVNITTDERTLDEGEQPVADLVVTTPTANSSVEAPRGGTAGFPNAKVRFTGAGEPDATVEIFRNNGKRGGTTTVDSDGFWEADVDAAFTKYSYFLVTQTSGTDSQTERISNVTIEQESTGFAVTNPKPNATVEAPAGGTAAYPNARLSVDGTGTPEAVVTFHRENGKVGGSTTVADDGTWTLDADINWGKWNVTVVERSAGAPDSVVELRNVTVAEQQGAQPFEITSPAASTEVASPVGDGIVFPNARVAFTGRATPGAEITVKRAHNDREAGTGTADANGDFSINTDFNWGTSSATVTETTDEGIRTVGVSGFSIAVTPQSFVIGTGARPLPDEFSAVTIDADGTPSVTRQADVAAAIDAGTVLTFPAVRLTGPVRDADADTCLTVTTETTNAPLTMLPCAPGEVNQQWTQNADGTLSGGAFGAHLGLTSVSAGQQQLVLAGDQPVQVVGGTAFFTGAPTTMTAAVTDRDENNRPIISGTTIPDATITVTDSTTAQTIGTAYSDETGAYSVAVRWDDSFNGYRVRAASTVGSTDAYLEFNPSTVMPAR